MIATAWGLMWVGALSAAAGADEPARVETARPTVLVVVGAPGMKEYDAPFREWAGRWRTAAEQGGAEFSAVGLDGSGTDDRERLQREIAGAATESAAPLWLVLIGHGTFDGKTARFNLRGPDVTSRELAEWISPARRPLAIIDCTSSSGPFLADLSGANRIVITATRSGREYNLARLGDYLSSAITDPRADLDKDEQTSLLEAFVLASDRVREFYAGDDRLATEHAMLDDNGDGLGTPAEWFQGVRVVKSSASGAAADGLRASHLVLVPSESEFRLSAESRMQRDAWEQDLAALRSRRNELSEEEYLNRLEQLLVPLGRLYAEGRAGQAPDAD